MAAAGGVVYPLLFWGDFLQMRDDASSRKTGDC
nr:MAG TPA: hypothetical protein [Caudoviricetes sp.]